jgi:hypothetical protein
MRRFNLITIVATGCAALTVAGAALAAVRGAPVDLYKTNAAFGDDHPLAKGVTYRATLFPLRIAVRPTDGLWRGSQWVEKNGLVEGSERTAGLTDTCSCITRTATPRTGRSRAGGGDSSRSRQEPLPRVRCRSRCNTSAPASATSTPQR